MLFNAALDLGYMVGGVYLMERSKNSEQSERLKGFGQAVIVNGGFLLIFDSIMYYMHANHESSVLIPLLENIQISTNSAGLRWQF